MLGKGNERVEETMEVLNKGLTLGDLVICVLEAAHNWLRVSLRDGTCV